MSEPRRRGDSGPSQEPICVVTMLIKEIPGEKIVVHVFSFLAVPGAPPSDTRLVTRAGQGEAHYYTYDCSKGRLEEKWLYDVVQSQPTTSMTLAPPFEPRAPELVAQAVEDQHALARKIGRWLHGDPDLIDDVTQETVLRAIEHPGGQEIGNPEAYVVGMMKRAAQEALRARDRLGPSLDAELEGAPEEPSWVPSAPSPVEGLVAQETASLIWATVARLPRRRKETAVLVFVHGLTHEEAATLLGTSDAVTRDAAKHARRVLQGSLRRDL